MKPARIFLLGDPTLRMRCNEVVDFEHPAYSTACQVLAATLKEFRRVRGFGRAISAPQIGLPLRLIAADLGDGPMFVSNPVIRWRSEERFTMWDDCMSFPDLLVRLSRHRSISLDYFDEKGAEKNWSALPLDHAELFQHELDHLDGILAVDRAEGRDALVAREVFESRREMFENRVDWISGTPVAFA